MAACMATTTVLGRVYTTTRWMFSVAKGGVDAIAEIAFAAKQFVSQASYTGVRMLESLGGS